MKRLLLIGENSYIGHALCAYASDRLMRDRVSARDGAWQNADFRGYDAILHCAAIVHSKQRKRRKTLYFQVNRDLPVAIANKAKAEGVRQFIFLSTMSVYGMDRGVITRETTPNPKPNDFYAQSKYEAEQLLAPLADSKFKLAILRPPMVYGDGCKGNYQRLCKLVKRLPLFPDIENQRSMLHIDTLSVFLADLVDAGAGGVFHPQDAEYVCTTALARAIAAETGKRLRVTKRLNWAIYAAMPRVNALRKLFGSLCYATDMSGLVIGN
jgi:UDP-glucose 4-epimerase